MACEWQCVREVALQLKTLSEKRANNWERFARSAYSRHYYAAFHRARAWGTSQGKDPYRRATHREDRVGSDHLDIWHFMAMRTGVAAFQDKGHGAAHALRVTADYDLKQIESPFQLAEFEFGWIVIDRLHELMDALPDQWPTEAGYAKETSENLKKSARSIFTRR